jgi:hypothetical protein
MTTRLEAIRARAAAATPGLWKCWNGWGPVVGSDPPLLAMQRIAPDPYETGGVMATHDGMREDRDLYATRADAEFVAYAHKDIAALLVVAAAALEVGHGTVCIGFNCRLCDALVPLLVEVDR